MLMAEVCRQADVPVIMAGSIDTTARIQIVRDAGAAGFTVGTAALDERFPALRPGLLAQLKTILAAASEPRPVRAGALFPGGRKRIHKLVPLHR